MTSDVNTSEAVEESRIREAYARRTRHHRYSWFDAAHVFLTQERERVLLRRLRQFGCDDLSDKRVLDVGCGHGVWLREFIKYGASPENLVGIDLLPDRVAAARRLCPAGSTLICGSAAQLDFPDRTFDCVLQSTVFTSILDDSTRKRVAQEMVRVLRPHGFILWYDFRVNNPNNPDVRRVSRKEIRKLFPGCRISLRSITLAPPLCRRVAPCSWLLCYLLSMVPLLCTHYLGVITRENTPG
jgi:ubiquinone/menaquinone biosynthesis C-methylase UbiE